MQTYDLGVLKVTYSPTGGKVDTVTVITDGLTPPLEITRACLIDQIHQGKKAYKVREIIPGRIAPLTLIELIKINGEEFLKTTLDRSPSDDL